MARVIEGGPSAYDAFLCGDTHPSVSNYIQSSYDRVGAVLTDVGRTAMDSARRIYESTVNHSAYRVARAAMRRLDNLWMTDAIQPLLSVSQLQHAPSKMVAWIMSDPTIKSRWLSGRCEGYGDEYVDFQNGAVGVEDSLYRAVTNGMLVDGDENSPEGERNWVCVNYLDEERESHGLSFDDQSDILDSQEAAVLAISLGKDDPTSRWNASL